MRAVGVDIVETTRIAEIVEKRGRQFLDRIFTPAELAYCNGKATSLAARWAAKEAMSKAFGTGIGKIAFKDIEIVNNSLGKPDIVLHNHAQQMAQDLQFERIAVSLSHTATHAIAFVVVD